LAYSSGLRVALFFCTWRGTSWTLAWQNSSGFGAAACCGPRVATLLELAWNNIGLGVEQHCTWRGTSLDLAWNNFSGFGAAGSSRPRVATFFWIWHHLLVSVWVNFYFVWLYSSRSHHGFGIVRSARYSVVGPLRSHSKEA